ncbi:MAG: complex I NDUFA9 subunit family protein, partial [Pseudomonadota bacterium]
NRGHKVRVLSRDLRKMKSLRVVPSIDVQQVDPYDTESLADAIKGQHVVINLVGILNTSVGKGGSFEEAHVDLASNIRDACATSGVKRVIQISSLKADAEDAPSEYLRSKGRAVNILRDSELDLTVFCPSVIFGNGDGLFTRFANLLQAMPFMPLACPDARFAPVYVGDVAGRVADAIDDAGTIGQSYNLCGPDILTLREIVEYTAEVLDISRPIVGLPNAAAKAQAFVMELIPSKPFSRDNYESLQVDSICESCDGTAPTSIKKIVPTYLGKMNRQSRLQHYRELARRDDS